ncbi:MAG: hypothetical protein AB7F78_17460 [Hyphomicrobiaceae bacterium]
MAAQIETTNTDEIRVLEGNEIDHVAGGGLFGSIFHAITNIVSNSPPVRTATTVYNIYSWLRRFF